MRNTVCVSNLDPEVHRRLKDLAKKRKKKLGKNVTMSDLFNEGALLVLQHYDEAEEKEPYSLKPITTTSGIESLEAVNA